MGAIKIGRVSRGKAGKNYQIPLNNSNRCDWQRCEIKAALHRRLDIFEKENIFASTLILSRVQRDRDPGRDRAVLSRVFRIPIPIFLIPVPK